MADETPSEPPASDSPANIHGDLTASELLNLLGRRVTAEVLALYEESQRLNAQVAWVASSELADGGQTPLPSLPGRLKGEISALGEQIERLVVTLREVTAAADATKTRAADVTGQIERFLVEFDAALQSRNGESLN